MGTFKTEKTIPGQADLVSVAQTLESHFVAKGYSVHSEAGTTGIHRISLHKGGSFKSVLGLKTALNVELTPTVDGTKVSAGIGVFGQQAVPTALTFLVAWPVALTQIWGMVQQSKLDDEAVSVAEAAILGQKNSMLEYCTHCGKTVASGSRFCGQCGQQLEAEENL